MRISADHHIFSMSSANEPVAEVEPGSVVTFEAMDCFSNALTSSKQLFSSIDWHGVNPATGPLSVLGALPGDILKVEILDIRLADQGVMVMVPGFGVLDREITKEITKLVWIEEGTAILNDRVRLPIAPMIGVIGVAPSGEPIATGTPGDHGSNMDCKHIVKGSILYLPVEVPGALLALGDLHAVMGDGEVAACGVEIPGEVDIRVSVLKGVQLPTPFLVEGGRLMTIASAETLDAAVSEATRRMHHFLQSRLGIETHEAGMLLSAAADLRICQVVDPLKTARMELPVWVAERYGFCLD